MSGFSAYGRAIGIMTGTLLLSAIVGCSGGNDKAQKDSVALAREKRCSDTANAVVSASGVGPVRLGMTLSEVAGLCPVVDSLSGQRSESVYVATLRMGRFPVELEVGVDSVVTSITLSDSAFRTDRGVGVGSRIRTLRFAYGRVCAVDRNGEAVLAVAGLDGLTFTFDPSSLPATIYRTRILGSELQTDAADDLPVRQIHIGRFTSPCREQRLAGGPGNA